MERLDNYSIALCLYLLKGNTLYINTTVFETLPDDLHDYFDLLRSYLGAEQPALFKLERYNEHCDVILDKTRKKELKELLTKYVDDLVKDKLESRSNVLSWKNELKAFVNKAKASGYNMKSYNVSVEDMHVVLYGLIQNIFKLNHIDIIPDEVVPCFYDRDTSGDVESGDVSKFYECLKVSCTVDVSTFMNKQTQKNTKHSPNSTKEDWLYKYICEATGRVSTSIPMQFKLIDVDQSEPNTYPNLESFKMSYNRLNKRYYDKYGVKHFVKKVKNEDLFRITFAKNDDGSLF